MKKKIFPVGGLYCQRDVRHTLSRNYFRCGFCRFFSGEGIFQMGKLCDGKRFHLIPPSWQIPSAVLPILKISRDLLISVQSKVVLKVTLKAFQCFVVRKKLQNTLLIGAKTIQMYTIFPQHRNVQYSLSRPGCITRWTQ
jgi:hypothetical protein